MIRFCLSYLYLCILCLHRLLFKWGLKHEFTFKSFIISIGSLSAGGAGKTPMVMYLSNLMSSEKLNHSVVSRGYKRGQGGTTLVSNRQEVVASVKSSGDEPFLLANSLPGVPVVVGNKKKALNLSYKLFTNPFSILDDGFQSHEIIKNLNILLVDLSLTFNDYRLFPRGYLRAPVSDAGHSNIIVFTKCNFSSGDAKKIKNLILSHANIRSSYVFTSDFILTLEKYCFKNRCFIKYKNKIDDNLVAFCGVANPQIFKNSVSLFCKKTFNTLVFTDHHSYTKKNIKTIKHLLEKSGSNTVLTTKKDFNKVITYFENFDIFVVDVKHEFNNAEQFRSVFLKKIKPS